MQKRSDLIDSYFGLWRRPLLLLLSMPLRLPLVPPLVRRRRRPHATAAKCTFELPHHTFELTKHAELWPKEAISSGEAVAVPMALASAPAFVM